MTTVIVSYKVFLINQKECMPNEKAAGRNLCNTQNDDDDEASATTAECQYGRAHVASSSSYATTGEHPYMTSAVGGGHPNADEVRDVALIISCCR